MAAFSDYDRDGDLDLAVSINALNGSCPISIFANDGTGEFADEYCLYQSGNKPSTANLSAADFDQDGDMDFIAGNLGLNYKYKTSQSEPFDIYYEDFDGNGQSDTDSMFVEVTGINAVSIAEDFEGVYPPDEWSMPLLLFLLQ